MKNTTVVVRLARWGLLLGLLLTAFAAPGVYAVTAGALLLLHVLAIFEILAPPARLVLSVATTVMFPLCAQAAGAGDAAVLGGLLALPRIHSSLRSLASSREAAALRWTSAGVRDGRLREELRLWPGRSGTPLSRTLGLTGALVTGLGLASGQGVLATAGGVLLAWLLSMVGWVLFRVPSKFVEATPARLRVVAGKRSEGTVSISPITHLPCMLYVCSPYPWVETRPRTLRLDGAPFSLRLPLTPPLAGPAMLTVEALAIDPWGLTVTRQSVDVVRLHVIPRARYAAWLARRYLEQTSTRPTVFATSAIFRRRDVRGGLEYYGARGYAPGDSQRDIDWKRTVKLQKLIVKEFHAAGGQAAILAVGLDAPDADAADRLSYELLMTALTLAQERIPMGLAGYTQEEVINVTPLLASREAVVQALKFTERIERIAPVRRTLGFPNIGQLRRMHRMLQQAPSRSRLVDLIAFEIQVAMNTAANHPATWALRQATTYIRPPASIVTLSATNEHKTALDITLDQFRTIGYRPVSLAYHRGRIAVERIGNGAHNRIVGESVRTP